RRPARVAVSPLVRRSGEGDVSEAVVRRHVLRITELFPDLVDIVRLVLDAEPDALRALFAFCNEYVALVNEPARETQRRNLLVRLLAEASSDAVQSSLRRAIALSDLRSGVVDRALDLASLAEDDPLR